MQNDETLRQDLKAAEAAQDELRKALKDIANAKTAAEKDRSMASYKLKLTQKEVLSLKKDVERAREDGRDNIRSQVCFAIQPILSPSRERSRLP